MEADCLSVDEVRRLAVYDCVVAGSAIHDQAWLPEGRRFAVDNATLSTKPVWLFSAGMPGALGRPLRRWEGRRPEGGLEPTQAGPFGPSSKLVGVATMGCETPVPFQ